MLLHQLGENLDLVADGLLQLVAHRLMRIQLRRQQDGVAAQPFDDFLTLLHQSLTLP